jgi:GNAT superfamily N-acetyltransferase
LAAEELVRPAGREDLPMLAAFYRRQVELQGQMAGTFSVRPEYDWGGYAARKLAAANRAVLVAVAGDELVGFIEVSWRRSAPEGGGGWRKRWAARLRRWRRGVPAAGGPVRMGAGGVVEEIFVAEPWRGQGWGGRLLRAGLERLAGEGVAEVAAGIWEANGVSLRFFTGQGFAVSRLVVRREVGGADQGSKSASAV